MAAAIYGTGIRLRAAGVGPAFGRRLLLRVCELLPERVISPARPGSPCQRLRQLLRDQGVPEPERPR